jgi:hypothetical protein
MVSFLTTHILNKISEETIRILNKTGSNASFIFFDAPIRDGKYLIDRVNKISPFEYDKVLPISWYRLNNLTILKIYNKLKNKEIK